MRIGLGGFLTSASLAALLVAGPAGAQTSATPSGSDAWRSLPSITDPPRQPLRVPPGYEESQGTPATPPASNSNAGNPRPPSSRARLPQGNIPPAATATQPSTTRPSQPVSPPPATPFQPGSDADAAGLRSTLNGTDRARPNAQQQPGSGSAWGDSVQRYTRPQGASSAPAAASSGTRKQTSRMAPMANRHTGRTTPPGQPPRDAGMRPGTTTPAAGAGATRPGALAAVRKRGVTSAPQRGTDVPVIYEVNDKRSGRTRPLANPIAPGARIQPQDGTVVIAARRPVVREPDPYDATGFRSGSFILRPSLDINQGYDSNPTRLNNGGKGSMYTQGIAELQGKSDWSRHEMTFKLRGSYTHFYDVPGIGRPELATSLGGRVDINRDTRAELEARYNLTAQLPGSANLTGATATTVNNLPLIHQIGATAALIRDIQRFQVTWRNSVDHYSYGAVNYSDGTVQDNSDLNYVAYGSRLRLGYELSAGIRPFVETGIERRVADTAIDRNGLKRGSTAYNARAGIAFNLTGNLTGEASAGYEHRQFNDPSLTDLRGAIVDASLIWTPSGLTTVTLTAKTATDETALVGASGILRRDFTAKVDHAFRYWLTGTALVGVGYDTFQGIDRADNRLTASVALTYKMTRSLSLKGELRHERLTTTAPGLDYTANIVMVGLRLQR